MNIWQFIFSFLYTRDWYNGKRELSTPKVALFVGMLTIIIVGVLLAAFLQAPVTYSTVG